MRNLLYTFCNIVVLTALFLGGAGIISCIAFSPLAADMLAVGAYSGVVGCFDARTCEQLYVLQGHKGGVTQVCSPPVQSWYTLSCI